MNGISQQHYWFYEVVPIQHPVNRTYPYSWTQERNKRITLVWKKLDFKIQ